MLTIGLTGGIACGKTTIAKQCQAAGALVIDADQISRGLTRPGGEALPKIREAFGEAVFTASGELDRAKLADIVFHDEKRLEQLNAVIHPMVHGRLLAEIERCRETGERIVILDVPLLFETGMDTLADITVCVSAPEETQIARLSSRDGLTREQALSRIRSQWPLARKEAASDIVIHQSLDFRLLLKLFGQ